jgi:nitrogen regulation protein NR(I)
VVDDDRAVRFVLATALREAGHAVEDFDSAQAVLDALHAREPPALLFTDVRMPGDDGLALLQRLKAMLPQLPVIVMSAYTDIASTAGAFRGGAWEFLSKPFDLDNAVALAERALPASSRELAAHAAAIPGTTAALDGDAATDALIGDTPAMRTLFRSIGRLAQAPLSVLVTGETGTGKELIARVIQGIGDRATKPFVTVNCGAIPANLVESTLFGHKKGAFTGAVADHSGKFTEANGGTLFLDEIGELPPEAQAKLLRALQEGEIEPVGGSRVERVNVRVISATNRRLLNLAQAGGFREDLYYRLNVFPIYLPPLRDRREDIELLAGHFITRFAAEAGKRIAGLSGPALDLLAGYDWPGNIRQLENSIYRAIVLSDGGYLEIADFPQIVAQARGREESLKLTTSLALPSGPVHIDAAKPVTSRTETREAVPDRFLDAKGDVRPLETLERELIEFALKLYGGRMSKVARALGIGRSTLYRKLRDYGLEGDFSDAA